MAKTILRVLRTSGGVSKDAQLQRNRRMIEHNEFAEKIRFSETEILPKKTNCAPPRAIRAQSERNSKRTGLATEGFVLKELA